MTTRCLFFLACLTLCACSCARAQQEETLTTDQRLARAREFYQAGQKLLQQGEFARANEEFSKAELVLGRRASVPREEPLQPSPAQETAQAARPENEYLDPDAHYNQGIASLKKGEFRKAEEAFQRVIALSPEDGDACYNLAVLYEHYLNDKEKALKFYLRYLNLAPDAQDAAAVRSWVVQLQAELAK